MAAARKASMRGALGARARIPAASRTHGGAPSMRKKLCGWMIGERAARGACSAGVLCRAAGSGDDDDLDWEPDAEVRRGRRRGDGDRSGASLQIQRARPSTSYGPGYERDADYGGRWSRRRGRNAPPRGGLFSRESLQTDTGRRNALLTVLLGGATATVVFSDATTYSQFDSDTLAEEVDLLVSLTGVLYARTNSGSFYEFYNNGRGTSLVVAKIGTKNAVFNLNDGGDDESYMELVSRSGRTVLVPKEYIRMLCEASRSIYDSGVLEENTGGVDVKPAPPQISRFKKYGGFIAPNGYRDDVDIKLMRFGGTLK